MKVSSRAPSPNTRITLVRDADLAIPHDAIWRRIEARSHAGQLADVSGNRARRAQRRSRWLTSAATALVIALASVLLASAAPPPNPPAAVVVPTDARHVRTTTIIRRYVPEADTATGGVICDVRPAGSNIVGNGACITSLWQRAPGPHHTVSVTCDDGLIVPVWLHAQPDWPAADPCSYAFGAVGGGK